MIRGVNQSMVNRYISRGVDNCKYIDNNTVSTVTIDCYALSTDTENLYLYENQLSPIVDMMKKNRLCNMIETLGLDVSMNFDDGGNDGPLYGTISCINNIKQVGPDSYIHEFNWSIFAYIDTSTPTTTTFTNVFNIHFDKDDGYTASILTKPVKFIDNTTNLTDAKIAKIKLIYN